MRNPALQEIIPTVGTNGTMTLGLYNAEGGGVPLLSVGQGFKRHPFRFYTKTPTIEEAERFPTPTSKDRQSVRFIPVAILLNSTLPPHTTATISRIRSGTEKVKTRRKKPFHQWNPLDETAFYPALPLESPPLDPGSTIEIEGVSYWFNHKKARGGRHRIENPMYIAVPSEPPPQVLMKQIVSLQLLIKLSWLPAQKRRARPRFVQGSPLEHQTSAPIDNAAAEPWSPDAEIPSSERWR